MKIPFKTVDDGRTKGIIVTAETLLALRREMENVREITPYTYNGGIAVINILEDCYAMIKKDY